MMVMAFLQVVTEIQDKDNNNKRGYHHIVIYILSC